MNAPKDPKSYPGYTRIEVSRPPGGPWTVTSARADGESTAAALLFVAAIIVSVLLGAMILALCSGCAS